MGIRETTVPVVPDVAGPYEPRDAYVPPRIERLGTLSELTLGGSHANDDGNGGAGDEGSV